MLVDSMNFKNTWGQTFGLSHDIILKQTWHPEDQLLATFLEVQRVTEHNKQNLICAALLIKVITF